MSVSRQHVSSALQQGIRLFQQGNLSAAEKLFQEILKSYPKHPDALHLQGLVVSMQGRKQDAVRLIRKAIKLSPKEGGYQRNLGLILIELDKNQEAITAFRKAISLNKRDTDSHNDLATIYSKLGRIDEAISEYRTAIRLDPKNAKALNNLGNDLLRVEKADQAIECFEKAIAINPQYIEAYDNLGNALRDAGQLAKAIATYNRALEIDPDHKETFINLGNVLLDQDKLDEAEVSFRRALDIDPRFEGAHINLGHVYHAQERFGLAIEAFQEAISLNPASALAYNGLGLALKNEGKTEEAKTAFRQAIQIDPDYSIAHYRLSLIQKHVEYDDEIKAMEALYNREAIPVAQRIQLAFGLGKAFDDLGDYPKAFSFISQGSEWQKNISPCDLVKITDRIKDIQLVITNEFINRHKNKGFDNGSAIFITGLSRSGKTLLETILSRHPLISAGGELKEFHRIVDDKLTDNAGLAYPESLRTLTNPPFDEIGREYIQYIQTRNKKEGYLINTHPGILMHIGLVRLCLPGARIIVCKRAARDTCKEIYMSYYTEGNLYSYDMQTLGQYYCWQKEISDYWGSLFPNEIHTVQLEDLIADPETEVKRVLDFCGVAHDDTSIEKLFSNAALDGFLPGRQEIVNRWKHYEEYLQPLFETLSECDE